MALPTLALSDNPDQRKSANPLMSTRPDLIDGSRPGNGYTITGTGFGTKSGTPVFEDFEAETLGAYPSGFDVPAGALTINNNESQATSVTTNNPRSGTRCIEQDYSVEGFPEIYRTLSGAATKHYYSCHFRWTGDSGVNPTVWKFCRIGANDVYSGTPSAIESWTSGVGTDRPAGFGGELRGGDGLVGWGGNADILQEPPTAYDVDQWHFSEMELDVGTVDGDDCFFQIRANGVVVLQWSGFSMLTTANSDLPTWLLTVMTGLDNDPPVTMWMDNHYNDESRARVVMTNNAVYASSTQWAVQPIATYSDTEVTVTPKRQTFAVGATAYLHLFNEDGVLVSEGNEVTVEEDA